MGHFPPCVRSFPRKKLIFTAQRVEHQTPSGKWFCAQTKKRGGVRYWTSCINTFPANHSDIYNKLGLR
jgi:hypothetical protein